MLRRLGPVTCILVEKVPSHGVPHSYPYRERWLPYGICVRTRRRTHTPIGSPRKAWAPIEGYIYVRICAYIPYRELAPIWV